MSTKFIKNGQSSTQHLLPPRDCGLRYKVLGPLLRWRFLVVNSVYQLCRGDLVVMAVVTATTHRPAFPCLLLLWLEVRGTRLEVRGTRYAVRGTRHKAALLFSLAEEWDWWLTSRTQWNWWFISRAHLPCWSASLAPDKCQIANSDLSLNRIH